MKSSVTLASVLLAAAFNLPSASLAQAPAPMTPQEDYAKRLRAAELVSPLTSDLFGDSVSLFNGATEFAVADIDIPGNSGLPVQLRRRFVVESRKEVSRLGGFGVMWDIDVPYLHGVFDGTYKWNQGGSSGHFTNRCSQLWSPQVHSQINLREIWSGTQMHIPGEGDRELLHLATTTHPVPTSNGPHPWTTRDGYRLRCKPTTSNGYPGEGFIAVASNGTKYTFDVGIERQQNPIVQASASFARVKVFLMASRVEDRHGNWVNYNYTAGRLTGITSSDQRTITLTYTGDRITRADANLRSWIYQYGSGIGFPNGDRLDQVVRPDLSAWTYQYSTLPYHEYPAWDGPNNSLCAEGPPAAGADFTLTATHPSGAVGTFNFPYVRQGRGGIPRHLACVADGAGNWSLYIANYFDGYLLASKTISGPGLTPATWSYSYGNVDSSLFIATAAPCTTCQQTKVVVVTQPDGSRREHEFGVVWSHNEGRLLRTSTIAPNNTVLRTETHQYVTGVGTPCVPFPDVVGINTGSDDPTNSIRLRPVQGTTITQQGVTFSSTINCFDDFARPLSVTRSSTLGHSRTEVSEYHDDKSLWAVGQVKKTTVGSVEASRVEYNTAALPWRVYAFGKLQQTLTYQTDGMLQTVVDGRNNTTTLSSWKRGIAQLIQFADTKSMSAVVNDSGWITLVTDQNSYQTGYDYDSMGRLSTITYPSPDTTAWNTKTLVFAQIGSSEYGIPAGHWRQTISNGAARKVSYFDALWRPVITHEYDTNNMVGTQRFSGWKYDHDGRVSFAGYPRSSAANISSFDQGTTSEYDALGRPTLIRQNSELGLLDTTIAYLSNFQAQVINPRGHTTTSSYMVYDQPTTDWPIAITHPEGAYTDITRDVFGKPMTLTRRNSDSSIVSTRSYVYDANHQLCKTIEPETGSTIMTYDAAGNLDWSAGGQNFPSTTACDTASVAESAKVKRLYDVRNRLEHLNFPNGLGDQILTYHPDGLVETITAFNSGGWTQSVTGFEYNKRRLLELENLVQTNGPSWTLDYAYTANAHPASVIYPSGLVVDFAPNALGQATKAGTYATGVSYHPNGAIAQFTYGNGLVHTLTQSLRGLPDRGLDTFGSTAVLDDSYDFDANGNVALISDGLPGARGTRTLLYDGLDRLTSATSVMFNPTTGGPATFAYDVLDNLKRVRVASRDHTYVYDTKQRLERVTNTTGGATVTTLAYDVQGNLATKNATTYQFDFGNRLREVIGLESYGYDGQGRRVRATHPTQGTIYSLYGMDGVLRGQRDERVGKSFEYIYLGGSLVARVSTPIALSTPTLTAPGYSPNGSYSVSWTSSAAATRYELQESVNSGTWTLIQNTSATSRSMSGKSSGSYRYRVRACHPATCGNWSAEATVVVELPPANPPSLTVPAQGLNGSYTVTWGTVAGATSVTLEESFNSGAWTTVYTGSAQSKAFTSKAAGSYRYRIQACNGAGCSSVSAASSPVQVIYPPSTAPTVSVPATSPTGGYTVSWNTVGGANRYQLDEQVNGGAWSQIQDSSATTRSISGKGNGSYGYRARACNDAGCSSPSITQTVVVTLPPASAPTLTVPSSNTNGVYTVSWSSVGTAASYELQERTNGGSWSTIQNTSSTNRGISGKGNGSYDYQVRACNVGGCGGYSTIQGVTVLLPPSSAPTLTAPSSTPVDNYTVSWTTVATASSYELQERFNGGSWSMIQNTSSTNRGLSGKPNGAYDYQVRACNGSGCGSYSAIATVSVNVPQPPATAPSLFGPGLIFEGQPYDMSWSAVGGATTYRLEERFNGGSWLEVHNGAGTIKSFPGRGQGLYDYRVRACNGAGCGSYSTIQTTAVQASCPFPPCDPGFTAEDEQ